MDRTNPSYKTTQQTSVTQLNAGAYIQNARLIITPQTGPFKFWEGLNEYLKPTYKWDFLTVNDIDIPRGKIWNIAKLNIPVDTTQLQAIAERNDRQLLYALAHRSVDPIFRAVYLGDYALVEQMLNKGAPANLVYEWNIHSYLHGSSLLSIAFLCNHEEIFGLLLDRGAGGAMGPQIRADFRSISPRVAFHLVRHNYLDRCALTDPFGMSPIHRAAHFGDIEELQFWLDAGAFIDSKSKNGNTPLWFAIRENKKTAVELLLKSNADLKLNDYISTAIALNAPIDILKLLVEYGSRIPTKLGTALLPAINTGRTNTISFFAGLESVSGQHIQELLLEMESIFTKLASYEAFKINSKLAKILNSWIDKVPSETVNSNHLGIPLLHHVMACCDEASVLKVLEKGADPNSTTDTGVRPLHLAAMRHFPTVAFALIEKGADPFAKDYTAATPLNHALSYYRTQGLAKKMISSELLQKSDPFYLYDSYKQLKIDWMAPHIQILLTNNPHLHNQWKEFYLIKICSHLFEVEGNMELTATDKSTEPLSFWREGLTSPMKLLNKIGKCTDKMASPFPNKTRELISSLCKFAADNIQLSDEDHLARIQSGHPTLIVSSKWSHSWYVLIYKSYFITCDGNLDEIALHRYDVSALTANLIGKLRNLAYSDNNNDAGFIIRYVKELLNLNFEMLSTVYAKYLNWIRQTIGNCTWKSLDCAIVALILLEFVIDKKTNLPLIDIDSHTVSNLFVSDPSMTDPIQIPLLDLWKLELKLYFASRYISRLEKPEHPYKPDYTLLGHMKFQLEDCGLIPFKAGEISKTLARIDNLRVAGQVQNVNKRANTDPCFSHYLIKHHQGALNYDILLKSRTSLYD